MVTSYNTHSPSAQIKLTAIRAGHGGLIHDGLAWKLTPTQGAEGIQQPVYHSDDAQAELTIVPGEYQIHATYQQKEIDCGAESFEKNTAKDLVFVLNTEDFFDADRQYSAETDSFLEYDRRRADREFEIPLGEIVTPVKDPNKKSGLGSQIAAHPLLSQEAQFDGMPPEITPDPTENEEATQKAELQLQQQLQNQAQPGPSVSPPSPSPFG